MVTTKVAVVYVFVFVFVFVFSSRVSTSIQLLSIVRGRRKHRPPWLKALLCSRHAHSSVPVASSALAHEFGSIQNFQNDVRSKWREPQVTGRPNFQTYFLHCSFLSCKHATLNVAWSVGPSVIMIIINASFPRCPAPICIVTLGYLSFFLSFFSLRLKAGFKAWAKWQQICQCSLR